MRNDSKLPVVPRPNEYKFLFKAGKIFKHHVLLSFIYSAGLRLKEVRNLKIRDVDCDLMMIHIQQTKNDKDRYVPISPLNFACQMDFILVKN